MAVLTPQPKMQFTTAAGVPLSGGKVYTYTAGTTTPQATYTDYTAATPNTNPVILDSRGEANIWLGSALYKFKLTDANDVEIWTVDYISAPTSAISPVLSGNVVIDSDTPTPALKITQTGTGPVLRVQDSADPDVTPFIIDTTGNVGVGTASPDAGLTVATVASFADGAAATPSIAHQSDLDTGVWFPAANKLAISTAGTERVRIDSSGNVGVGTSSPGERLQVSEGNLSVLGATGSSFTGFVNQNNGASASVYRGLFYDARNENSTTVASMLVNVETDGSSSWAWSTTPAGTRTSDRRAERVKITSDGNLQFNSGYGSAATAYGCRAWVNFNGTGTVAIRASGNVTSITDNGTGNYTVNFTNAIVDANYSFALNSGNPSGSGEDLWAQIQNATPTVSALRFSTSKNGTGAYDAPYVSAVIFR